MTPLARAAARTGRVVRDTLLSLAALGGAVCILFAILAFTGGYSLIMFKTGSMSPSIPAGSLALVQRIPASEIRDGDVVTVDRPGTLPITHRVTGIDAGPTDGERVITMRGDANAVEDPVPYTVSDVRIVRGSVPHVAPIVAQLGNPWVLGGLTLGTAVLVSWAFWPRRRTTEADDPPPVDEHSPPPPAGSRDRVGTAQGVIALVVLLTAAGASASVGASPASAAVDAGYLTLRSDLAGAGVQTLDPDIPLIWHVDVDATAAPADGDLAVAFSSTGDEGFGLQVEVRACTVPWQTDGTCTTGEQVLRPAAPLAPDGTWHPLYTASTPTAVFLRLALTADPENEAAGSAGADVTVRATAAGETEDTGIDGETELPPTGASPLTLLAAPAAIAIGLGIALAARRRPASRRTP